MRQQYVPHFGKKLKELREKNKKYFTKASLAIAVDIHPSYITNIEKFRSLPGAKVVEKLASILGSKELVTEYIKTKKEELALEINILVKKDGKK